MGRIVLAVILGYVGMWVCGDICGRHGVLDRGVHAHGGGSGV